jgi:hypothetical protein
LLPALLGALLVLTPTNTAAQEALHNADGDYNVYFVDLPRPDAYVGMVWFNNNGQRFAQYQVPDDQYAHLHAAVLSLNGWQNLKHAKGAKTRWLEKRDWKEITVPGFVGVGCGPANTMGMDGLEVEAEDGSKTGAIYQHGHIKLLGDLPEFPGVSYVIQVIADDREMAICLTDEKGFPQGIWVDRDLRLVRSLHPSENAILNAPLEMNDCNQICGAFYDENWISYGYYFDGEEFTTLTMPGFEHFQATGINKSGVMVGYGFHHAASPASPNKGFILDHGLVSEFHIDDIPDVARTSLNTINDFGALCGICRVATEPVRRIFIATPRLDHK